MLEVLKFLEAIEVLKSTSSVSAQWLHLSNSQEKRNLLCEWDGITAEDISTFAQSPKLAYEKLSDVQIHNLAVVTKQQLKLYDCRMHQFVYIRHMQVEYACSVVMATNEKIFYTANHRAFLYDFAADKIEEYPNTLERREYHGSARFRSRVYLFGGNSAKCQTAEKCSLTEKVWTLLSPMPIRHSGFTPCVHHRCIYLCGGNVAVSHLFHIDTEEYEKLPFVLPTDSWCVVTFVSGIY